MKKAFFSIFLLLLLVFPRLALASDDLGIGTIDTPPGVAEYQAAAEAETGADIGIIYFISNLIKIFAVVAGIWTLFNVILAGYIYITGSGDAGAHQKVQTQVTNSIIGLVLIVLSFTFGGLIGLIFFGDATFILSPRLPTP
ncbi:MAG: hypothetical protein QG639_224 [Patescibacteria group bacterium]|nr:hypothetical protein [Patescibacteria group bacterium]